MTDAEAWEKIKAMPVKDRVRLVQCVFCMNNPKTCNGKDDAKGMCKQYKERNVKINANN